MLMNVGSQVMPSSHAVGAREFDVTLQSDQDVHNERRVSRHDLHP